MPAPEDVEALAGRLLELDVDPGLVARAQELLGANPDEIGEWIELAVALRERGQFDAALAAYDVAMRRFPDSPILWSNRGVVFLEWELYGEALRHFERAPELAPDYVFAVRNVGRVHERLNEFAAAADACWAFCCAPASPSRRRYGVTRLSTAPPAT